MRNIRIVSESLEPFIDRQQAGRLLGWEFHSLRRAGVVVLSCPGPDMVVAGELARVLGADLDVVLARKLRAPSDDAVALGVVLEDGDVILDSSAVEELGVPGSYIAVERELQAREIVRQTSRLRRTRHKIPLRGRTVILTGESVTTGGSMLAALSAVRQESPKTMLAGIPVGPREAVDRVGRHADSTVCLKSPLRMLPPEQLYVHRDIVDEEQILAILGEQQRGDGRTQVKKPKMRLPARYLLRHAFARCFL